MRPNAPTTAPTTAENGRRHTLLSRLNRFGVDNGGSTAVIGAILFPIVVGGLGLGAETGYWYLTQRKLQHIADVSAHAAGARLRADDSYVMIEAAARHVAKESGYKGTPELDELKVNTPYPHEEYDDEKLVEVIASETQPRLFSAVVAGFFSSDSEMTVTMSARAVGLVEPGAADTRACVLALSPTKSNAVNVSGSAVLALEGCDIASNSNSPNSLNVTSSVTSGCAYAVGEAHTPALTLTVCDEVREYAPKVPDPYADVEEPDLAGITCEKDANGKNLTSYGQPNSVEPPLKPSQTLANGVPVMRLCNGFDAKGTIEFEPGIYVIEQSAFKMTSSNAASILKTIAVAGELGATFYFTNSGYLQLSGTRLQLAAPKSGPYSGLLFFGSRSGPTVTHQVGGNSESSMTGAIYTPASAITVSGNAAAVGGGCTQVIGDTVTFSGNPVLQSNCDGAGTSTIATGEVVRLIE